MRTIDFGDDNDRRIAIIAGRFNLSRAAFIRSAVDAAIETCMQQDPTVAKMIALSDQAKLDRASRMDEMQALVARHTGEQEEIPV